MIVRHRPQKRFGQHFLTDQRIADRIVGLAGIDRGDTVLEIGPGKGILTDRLLKSAKQVTAIEIDRDLAELLKKRFADSGTFRLIEADILSVDLADIFKDNKERIKVVSNIPYNISAPIIELLIRNRTLVSDAVLMVQKEVAARLVAAPGSKDYGLTTLNLALCAQSRKVMDIKPGAFSPPPEVMSSVIAIIFSERYLHPLSNERLFRELTGAAFRMRRKMIRNSMVPYMISRGITESDANTILTNTGINPALRPENIDVSSFVAISNSFHELIGESVCRENMRNERSD